MASMISPEEAKEYLAANIRRLMDLRGVGQRQLAEEADCSRQMIWYILRAERQASASILANIAEFFGVTVDELLSRPNGRRKKTKKIA